MLNIQYLDLHITWNPKYYEQYFEMVKAGSRLDMAIERKSDV